MSSPEADPTPAPAAGGGCWPAALVIVGGLIALLSGLCTGVGVISMLYDMVRGQGSVGGNLSVMMLYLAVGAPFLAGGVALCVWGRRIQRRQ
jgi:hypothetical protein